MGLHVSTGMSSHHQDFVPYLWRGTAYSYIPVLRTVDVSGISVSFNDIVILLKVTHCVAMVCA